MVMVMVVVVVVVPLARVPVLRQGRITDALGPLTVIRMESWSNANENRLAGGRTGDGGLLDGGGLLNPGFLLLCGTFFFIVAPDAAHRSDANMRAMI